MHVRKILRSGGSQVVVLPAKLVAELGWQVGDLVQFEVPKGKKHMVVRAATQQQQPVPPGLAAQMERFVQEYGEALRELRALEEQRRAANDG